MRPSIKLTARRIRAGRCLPFGLLPSPRWDSPVKCNYAFDRQGIKNSRGGLYISGRGGGSFLSFLFCHDN